VTRSRPSRREKPPALLFVGVALLAGLGLWLLARAPHVEPTRADEQPDPDTVAKPTLAAVARSAAAPPEPVAAAEPEDHPHPITPAHQRIFRENRIVGALDGAMDVKDVAAMRRFLQEYREDYPEDDNMLQDGYAVIADCFERPGEAARAAASRWADAHRGSTLRRFVNRHCLEP